MKRKVAILLTVCLLVGLIPLTTWAETAAPAEEAEEIVVPEGSDETGFDAAKGFLTKEAAGNAVAANEEMNADSLNADLLGEADDGVYSIYATGYDEFDEPTGYTLDEHRSFERRGPVYLYISTASVLGSTGNYRGIFVNGKAVEVTGFNETPAERIIVAGEDGNFITGDFEVYKGTMDEKIATDSITDDSEIPDIVDAFRHHLSSYHFKENYQVGQLYATDIHLDENVTVTVESHGKAFVDLDLTVGQNGVFNGKQDAELEFGWFANNPVGIELWCEDTITPYTDNPSHQKFIWLENDDRGNPINKWVKAVNETPVEQVLRELGNYVFAYGKQKDMEWAASLQRAMAEELTQKRINCDFSLGEILGTEREPESADVLKTYITIGTPSENGTLETGRAYSEDELPSYYEYEIRIPAEKAGTAEDAVATGKVYELPRLSDVLVQTKESGVMKYYLLKQELYQKDGDYFEKPRYLYANTDIHTEERDGRVETFPECEVFGNGVMANGLRSDDENVFGYHIAQEHCGNLVPHDATPSEKIGGTLIVSSKKETVKITSDKDAAAWNFENVQAYVPTADAEYPPAATVFCGAYEISFNTADFQNITGKKITNIEVLSNLANVMRVQETDGKWTLNIGNSGYDIVPLKFTYNDSSVGYLTLYKVGLDIKYEQKIHDDGQDKYVVIWHGTDQSIRYDADAENIITGTFYYDEDDTVSPYYADHEHPTDSEYEIFTGSVSQILGDQNRVSLFVTVTKTDGSVQRYSIDAAEAITTRSDALAVENGGRDPFDGTYPYKKDYNCAPGYAGQGTCHFYDDFILWKGSDAELEKILSVSAIVYVENDEYFGGVSIGSGTGVEWRR